MVSPVGGGLLAKLARSQVLPVRTDAAGGFEVGALVSGSYELQVRHPGYAERAVPVKVAAGETREVTLRLERGAAVTGRVLDRATGLGVPGAVVVDATDIPTVGTLGLAQIAESDVGATMRKAKEAAWTTAAETPLRAAFATQGAATSVAGEDGSYRLEHLPEGARQLVCVHRDHLSATRALTLTAGQPARADFALGSGGEIEGTVRGPGGAPIAGVMVQATAPGLGRRTAQTTDDGTYAIRGLAPGTYMVMVQGIPKQETARPTQIMHTVSVKEAGTTHLDFGDAPTGTALVGTISVAGGLPKKVLALLKADGGLPTAKAFLGTKVKYAESDGSFRFDDVAPGSYVLMIPPTYRKTLTVSSGQKEVRLDLRLPQRYVSGVVFRADGSLAEGAAVTAVRMDERDDPILRRRRAKATTDALGRFTLRPLDTTGYEIEATLSGEGPGKGVARQGVSLARADQTGLELRLAVTGTIHAKVVDPNGRPASGVTLIAVGADGRRYSTDKMDMLGSTGTQLDDLPAGLYTVWALSGTYAFDRRTGGPTVTVELGLSPGGSLEVRAIGPAGATVKDGRLELRLADGTAPPSTSMDAVFKNTRTGADGTLTRKRLKAGSYQGTVRTADGREGAFTATIRDGETTKVTVTLAAR